MKKGGVTVKRWSALLLVCCLLLTGCQEAFDGDYSSVKPHQRSTATTSSWTGEASDRQELYEALAGMVSRGEEEGVIYVGEYDQALLQKQMWDVRTQVEKHHPIGAYAVDWISFKEGTREDQAALSVHIHYIHDRSEIRNITEVNGVAEASRMVCQAMDQYDTSLVFRVRNFQDTDLVQVAENYALYDPQKIMEMPQVSVTSYPDEGDDRVIELRFDYQTSRDMMRSMKDQVQQVFQDAKKAAEDQKDGYRVLYDFLMDGHEHHITASITPAYSLLKYGVGDSRAFAQVYAAMCRESGLECLMVNGTKDGASHYWNIICVDGIYYHLDLLGDGFQPKGDQQMGRYVWDYAAYPICGGASTR